MSNTWNITVKRELIAKFTVTTSDYDPDAAGDAACQYLADIDEGIFEDKLHWEFQEDTLLSLEDEEGNTF
jgi:hypothetical protein